MGANYFTIIHNLITLKNELYRVENPKFTELINELKLNEVSKGEDVEDLTPNVDLLAQNLGYKKPKLTKLIKELNYELIRSFALDPPLQIKKVIHHIFIQKSDEELWQMPRTKREQMHKLGTWLTMDLPRTPRIGETIFIKFIEDLEKYVHGIVHDVQHNISGDCQEIIIEVHPFKNYYHKWVSLKEEYERDIKPVKY
jgi:predicted RND superfamily exporter protein